jgi:hypothetical protein
MVSTWVSAIWATAKWDGSDGTTSAPAIPPVGTVMLGLLGTVIVKMEAVNVGDSYWDRGLWEDGMWEHDTPMINTRKQMEKT